MSKLNGFEDLEKKVRGDLLRAGDPGFEDSVRIWNSRLQRISSVALVCRTAEDVAAAVSFARSHECPLAVKSGGHSYGGLGAREGALLLDLSKLNRIEIDADARRAVVGAGVRWGEFYEEAFDRGLGVSGGTVTTVGVAGFTLGGGSGWLSRKYGLGLDNLLWVEMVTSEGEVIQADESKNSDLFWGIRGGAGNFGIVTKFEFLLHDVPPEVFAGQILIPFESAGTALRHFREKMPETPDEFVCFPCAFRVPPLESFPADLHGQVVMAFVVAYIGDASEGEPVVRDFCGGVRTVAEDLRPTPFMDLLRTFDAGMPYGERWYSRAHYLDNLSDGAIETFTEFASELHGPFTIAYFGADDGAVSRVDLGATAFPHRDGPYYFHILAGWTGPDQDEAVMDWTREFHEAMSSHANGGVYVNLLAEDEEERIGEAYGENYERLVQLKKKWDPENLFDCNQNIQPR